MAGLGLERGGGSGDEDGGVGNAEFGADYGAVMLERGGDGVVREVVVAEGGFLAGFGEFEDGAGDGEVGEDRAVGAGVDGVEGSVRVDSGEVVVVRREREV